ncbi:Acylphosphatase [Coniochaeta sp. PMI_546]|nr:Acylphosphatase [Coniochaeta sp. PMI_546]
MSTSRRVYFLAHGGRVQGVGFRYFTRKRAVEYKLTGWVRNTDNNKVEGEAQGDPEAIKSFLKDVDKGPRHSHVVRLDHEDRDLVEGETEFQIRH